MGAAWPRAGLEQQRPLPSFDPARNKFELRGKLDGLTPGQLLSLWGDARFGGIDREKLGSGDDLLARNIVNYYFHGDSSEVYAQAKKAFGPLDDPKELTALLAGDPAAVAKYGPVSDLDRAKLKDFVIQRNEAAAFGAIWSTSHGTLTWDQAKAQARTQAEQMLNKELSRWGFGAAGGGAPASPPVSGSLPKAPVTLTVPVNVPVVHQTGEPPGGVRPEPLPVDFWRTLLPSFDAGRNKFELRGKVDGLSPGQLLTLYGDPSVGGLDRAKLGGGDDLLARNIVNYYFHGSSEDITAMGVPAWGPLKDPKERSALLAGDPAAVARYGPLSDDDRAKLKDFVTQRNEAAAFGSIWSTSHGTLSWEKAKAQARVVHEQTLNRELARWGF